MRRETDGESINGFIRQSRAAKLATTTTTMTTVIKASERDRQNWLALSAALLIPLTTTKGSLSLYRSASLSLSRFSLFQSRSLSLSLASLLVGQTLKAQVWCR